LEIDKVISTLPESLNVLFHTSTPQIVSSSPLSELFSDTVPDISQLTHKTLSDYSWANWTPHIKTFALLALICTFVASTILLIKQSGLAQKMGKSLSSIFKRNSLSNFSKKAPLSPRGSIKRSHFLHPRAYSSPNTGPLNKELVKSNLQTVFSYSLDKVFEKDNGKGLSEKIIEYALSSKGISEDKPREIMRKIISLTLYDLYFDASFIEGGNKFDVNGEYLREKADQILSEKDHEVLRELLLGTMNDSDFASYESLNKMDIHNLRIQLQAKSAFLCSKFTKVEVDTFIASKWNEWKSTHQSALTSAPRAPRIDTPTPLKPPVPHKMVSHLQSQLIGYDRTSETFIRFQDQLRSPQIIVKFEVEETDFWTGKTTKKLQERTRFLSDFDDELFRSQSLRPMILAQFPIKGIDSDYKAQTSPTIRRMIRAKEEAIREGLVEEDDLLLFDGSDINLISRLAIYNNLPSLLQNIKNELQRNAPLLSELVEKRLIHLSGHKKTDGSTWTEEDQAAWNIVSNADERERHPSLKLAYTLSLSIEAAAGLFQQHFTEKKQENYICQRPEMTFYTQEHMETWRDGHMVRANRAITIEEWKKLPKSGIPHSGPEYQEGWFKPQVQLLNTSIDNIELWSIILS
jgi:hypothetical protein